MPVIDLSKKQKQFLKSRTRVQICSGAVRSSKTFVACMKFLQFFLAYTGNDDCAIFGKTEQTIKRNVISTFEKIFNILYPNSGHKLIKYTDGGVRIMGKKCLIISCNDVSAEGKIKGCTLKYSLIDEVTEIGEANYMQILARHITNDDAVIIGTTNPNSQMHWLYKMYQNETCQLILDNIDFKIDKNKNTSWYHFTLNDNLTVSEQAIRELSNTYTGVFYDRNILGLWRNADGLVCPNYDPLKHVIPFEDITEMIKAGKFIRYLGACDWGYPNPSAVGIYGMTSNNEFYKIFELYDGSLFTSNIIEWINGKEKELKSISGRHVHLEMIFADSAEQDRINECRQAGLPINNAKKDRQAGFQYLDWCFANDKLFLSSMCKNTDIELQSCQFLKPDESGYRIDGAVCTKPDHAIDETRYLTLSSKLMYGII